jgi:uncharacterized protein (DUF58 family)
VVPPSESVGSVAAKAALLRRLEVQVTRRLDGVLTGEHRGVRLGAGSEPEGARPFAPGDDARRIDWNLTARSLDAHVRTTEPDRELETWVVADRSASLDFGTAEREKRDVALAAVAAISLLTARGGNRVGVVVAGGEKIERYPTATSRTAVLATLSRLHDTPRREDGPDPGADLTTALATLEHWHRRRGQVVVVSDFLDAGNWDGVLRRLGLRHDVLAVQVVDPRELALPDVGMMAVVDAESGRTMHVQTASAALRERYAAAAAARHGAIADRLRRAGARHVVLTTDRDWVVDLVNFLGRPAHALRRALPRPLAPAGAPR